MNSAKTAMGAAGATGTAGLVTTSPAATAVPFLDIPLFIVTINGVPGIVTPQASIFMLTGILGLVAVSISIWKALFKKDKK